MKSINLRNSVQHKVWCLVMTSVLSVDRQVILPTTALIPSVMAVTNLAILPWTAPSRLLHQEHNITMADLVCGIITTTTGGTDQNPIMVPDIGDITTVHSPASICAMTEVAVLEGTSRVFLPATSAAGATLQLMNAPITFHATVTPHPATATSPTGTTHATSWTRANIALATTATQHRDLNPRMSCRAQDPQLPKNPNVNIQDSHSRLYHSLAETLIP